MNICAIDCSSVSCSVCILQDGKVLSSVYQNTGLTHSQTLLVNIRFALQQAGMTVADMDQIAVTTGPGSFTGLRIGSATAKGLGLALDKPLISVPTVDALAYNLYDTDEDTIICPIMDARRKQVYTGMYCFLNHQMQVVKEQDAVALEELIKELNQMERPVIFLGDAVPVYKELIQESCKVPYSFAPAHLSRQRAGAVGMLGILYFKEGKTESAAEHKPEYLRVSQAERERAERLKQEKHE